MKVTSKPFAANRPLAADGGGAAFQGGVMHEAMRLLFVHAFGDVESHVIRVWRPIESKSKFCRHVGALESLANGCKLATGGHCCEMWIELNKDGSVLALCRAQLPRVLAYWRWRIHSNQPTKPELSHSWLTLVSSPAPQHKAV